MGDLHLVHLHENNVFPLDTPKSTSPSKRGYPLFYPITLSRVEMTMNLRSAVGKNRCKLTWSVGRDANGVSHKRSHKTIKNARFLHKHLGHLIHHRTTKYTPSVHKTTFFSNAYFHPRINQTWRSKNLPVFTERHGRSSLYPLMNKESYLFGVWPRERKKCVTQKLRSLFQTTIHISTRNFC